jgi:hypothetical protein
MGWDERGGRGGEVWGGEVWGGEVWGGGHHFGVEEEACVAAGAVALHEFCQRLEALHHCGQIENPCHHAQTHARTADT